MEESLKYEEPKLIELNALLMRGGMGIEDDGTTENVSDLEWQASFEDDDVAHETMEF